ncbi:MAG: C2H2-type zinc finger protein [Candidatus Methanomethylophilaceae archaeon]|nr:C2H2-type zinc finger protein [Candidatus Methanomethylophilaceae archaeon]
MSEKEFFCEACNKTIDARGKSGHMRSKKHLLNVSRLEDKKDIVEPVEEEIIEEGYIEEEPEDMENVGSIKIVTEGVEKEKGGLDKICDFLFSPQVAPVTLGLIEKIGNILDNISQKDAKKEEGQLVQTVSGALVRVKNKDF